MTFTKIEGEILILELFIKLLALYSHICYTVSMSLIWTYFTFWRFAVDSPD